MSDEIISSIIGAVTALITIPISAFWRFHKKSDVRFDEIRLEKVFFPVICILENVSFSYKDSESANIAINSIKDILSQNRIYAGERLQQYIHNFENAQTSKNKSKYFNDMCEYIIKEYNRLSTSFRLPKITLSLRIDRAWYNKRSVSFFIKLFIKELSILFIATISVLVITNILIQKLLSLLPLPLK